MDDTLVGTASEMKVRVAKAGYERAVNQCIDIWKDHAQTSVSEDFFVCEAGVAPDVLGAAEACAHVAQEGRERALVLRLHGFAAEKCEAGDPGVVEFGDDEVLRLIGERLAGGEVPCVGVEASLAVVGAARNEQRHAHSLSVRDVAADYA